MVGEGVYQQLVEGLKMYGAVRVEKITGEIGVGDERFKFPFQRELHRDPLFVDADRTQKIVVLDTPHQILGDAWTVAKIEGVKIILAFTFPLGTTNWEQRLAEKCSTVEKFCREHGGYPLVDFDARQRRFSTGISYPEIVKDWYDQIAELLKND